MSRRLPKYTEVAGYALTDLECECLRELSANRWAQASADNKPRTTALNVLSMYRLATKSGRLFHVTQQGDYVAARLAKTTEEIQ